MFLTHIENVYIKIVRCNVKRQQKILLSKKKVIITLNRQKNLKILFVFQE